MSSILFAAGAWVMGMLYGVDAGVREGGGERLENSGILLLLAFACLGVLIGTLTTWWGTVSVTLMALLAMNFGRHVGLDSEAVDTRLWVGWVSSVLSLICFGITVFALV